MRKSIISLVTASALMLAGGMAASASTPATITQAKLTASVSGDSVTVDSLIKASSKTRVSHFGVCARDEDGGNVDFDKKRRASLTTEGKTFTATQALPDGEYTFFACAYTNGSWWNGPADTFTVDADGAETPATPVVEAPVEEAPVVEAPTEETPVVEAPTEETPVVEAPVEEAPVVEAPVEEAPVEEAPVEEAPVEEAPVVEAPVEEAPVEEAPVEEAPVEEAPVEEAPVEQAPVDGSSIPVGDLDGWTQKFAEDFTTDAATGQFQSTYANSWCGYQEGTGGQYYNDALISAHDGLMDIALNGTQGAAGSFGPPETCWGDTYGRYSIKFKAEGAEGNGTAMMIWPSSDVWGDGEIDFPEGNLDGTFHAFQHPLNCSDCSSSVSAEGSSFADWHVATTEWSPAGVNYYVDGELIMATTDDNPTTDHRWTIQVAPTSDNAQPGHLLIDWVTSYSYNS
jgi:hypothetical protein